MDKRRDPHASIARLVDLLCGTSEVREQRDYLQLLIREVDQFGRDEERLEALHQCLMRCNRHIYGQRKLIDWLAWRGHDTALANELLNSLFSIRDGFTVQIQFRMGLS